MLGASHSGKLLPAAVQSFALTPRAAGGAAVAHVDVDVLGKRVLEVDALAAVLRLHVEQAVAIDVDHRVRVTVHDDGGVPALDDEVVVPARLHLRPVRGEPVVGDVLDHVVMDVGPAAAARDDAVEATEHVIAMDRVLVSEIVLEPDAHAVAATEILPDRPDVVVERGLPGVAEIGVDLLLRDLVVADLVATGASLDHDSGLAHPRDEVVLDDAVARPESATPQ